MRFLKKVQAARTDATEAALQKARAAIVKRVMKEGPTPKSASFKRELVTWRKAWKEFHGFSLTPKQEQLALEVYSEREQDSSPQTELKEA